ncbi:MAG: hypothetical protein AAGA58_10510 [Verrucomicrobiota bacterium]
MHQDEQNDPVWKLLGKSRSVEVDPFFAKKTVREARRLEENRNGLDRFMATLGSFVTGPRLAAAACILAISAFAVSQLVQDSTSSAGQVADVDVPAAAPIEEVPDAVIVQLEALEEEPIETLDNEYQSIEFIDNLVAVQDATLLSDADIAALLF